MFANIVWPRKLAISTPLLCIFDSIIDGMYLFSHSLANLANIPQEKNVRKHTPPQIWGARLINTWVIQKRMESTCAILWTNFNSLFEYIISLLNECFYKQMNDQIHERIRND